MWELSHLSAVSLSLHHPSYQMLTAMHAGALMAYQTYMNSILCNTQYGIGYTGQALLEPCES